MSTAFMVLIFVSGASAQVSRRNDKVATLSPDDAAQRWAQFSQSRPMADYCMKFTLTHIPRKAVEVVFNGEIFGAQIGVNSYMRIRIWKADEVNNAVDYILLDSPVSCKVWRAEADKFIEVPKKDWSKPMCKGLIYSPFDFLTPFKSWKSSYDGAGRIGQAVHYFILTPEKNADNRVSDISKVRVALTREFNSPAQIETFDASGELAKTMSLGSVRKVDGLWIMLEADMRDDISRDKDKLRFTAAKLRANIPAEVFDTAIPVAVPQIPLLESL